METRPIVQLLRLRYQEGRTTKEQLERLVKTKRISKEEYDWIQETDHPQFDGQTSVSE